MRRALHAVPLIAGALILAGCQMTDDPEVAEAPAAAEAAPPQIETLDADYVSALMARDEVTMIDVRTPAEFASGHLEGAINMPIASFDPAKVKQVAGKQPIFYCRSGRRSLAAAEAYAAHDGQIGHHLEGGILAWEESGQPIVR